MPVLGNGSDAPGSEARPREGAVAVASRGSIDVAETNFGRRVQKFKIVDGR